VTGPEQEQRLVAELPTGNQASIQVRRQGRTVELKVRIEAMDEKASSNAKTYLPGLILTAGERGAASRTGGRAGTQGCYRHLPPIP
jgi:hypothetical protein